MDATVTIVNYNTRAKLADCLRSIRETTATGPVIEVIIVDNGSTDGSVEMVRQDFPECRIVATGENLGFGRAHNRAMAMGTGRYFIVLNPDTIVQPHCFARLIAFMEATPGAAVCGPMVKDAHGAVAHSGHKDHNLLSVMANAFNLRALLPSDQWLRRWFGGWLKHVHSAYDPHDGVRTVDWIDGACLVVRRTAYEQVGAFDEAIFLNGEDYDWCLRFRQAGWAIYHVPDVEIVHLMHQSKDQVYVPSFVAYYWAYVYLFQKHNSRLAYLTVRATLVVAFFWRLIVASIARLLAIRPRPKRETDAYRAVIRTTLFYSPLGIEHSVARR